ncbi:MAG: type II toxin-antitoxin system RelE/ParE family toxin [Neisseriaceae bacterium]|nr:type II toxin-antitoxin system RelE/ParE family toxin [Neisseriaceae bacterium]
MQQKCNIIMLDPFWEWFMGLSEEAIDKIYMAIEVLKQNGSQQGRPLVDTLKGSQYPNMKELRVPFGRSVFRICFIFDPKRNAVLICGGNKQGKNEKKFYKELIALAENTYEQYLQQIQEDKQ